MNGWFLLGTMIPVTILGGGLALLGTLLCRRWRLMVRAMGSKGEKRPAALGLALFGAFLTPLTYHVCVRSTTRIDRMYSPETQSVLIAVLCGTSLLLLVWGWRCDRRRSGLETILVMWGAQAAMWIVGLRIDRVSLGLFGLGLGDFGIGVLELPVWASLVVTLLWLSLVASVVELLDGIDGMAGLIVGLSSIGVFTYTSMVGSEEPFVKLFAWLLAASSLLAAWLGRPSGRLLLGKNGSFLLGFWLATLTVLARQKEVAVGILTPLLVIVLVLVVVLFRFIEGSLGFSRGPARRGAASPPREGHR